MLTRDEIREVVLATLKEVGLYDRQISQRAASAQYGKWFRDAVGRGDLKPCRTGGRTRWFSVAEINAYEAAGRAEASLQRETITIKHDKIRL